MFDGESFDNGGEGEDSGPFFEVVPCPVHRRMAAVDFATRLFPSGMPDAQRVVDAAKVIDDFLANG